jgi:glycosyltransferase-like protein
LELVRDRVAAFKKHLESSAADFDVLHAHDGMGGNALADLQSQGLIQGFVRTVHHLDPFEDPELQRLQMRSVTQAAEVLCVSQLWQERLQVDHGITAHPVCNGVDAKRFSAQPHAQDLVWAEKLGIQTGQPILLSVGGIESRKNTVRLLQAFALWRSIPGFERAMWVIAGGASLLDHSQTMQNFREELERLGLRAAKSGKDTKVDVLITGALPDEALPSLYRLADVVAMPSLREGFGLVVLEALCSGKPVVVSKIAPFTEHLQDIDVVFSDPEDQADMARALDQAYAQRGSPQLVQSGSRLAQQFSWSKSAQQHLAIYQRFLNVKARLANHLQEIIPCL